MSERKIRGDRRTEEGEEKRGKKEILPDKTRFNDEMAALMSK